MTPRPKTSVLWIADHQPASTAFPSLSDPDISIHSFHTADGRLSDLSLEDLDCIILEARPRDDSYMLLARQLTALTSIPILWIGESEESCFLGLDLGAADFLLQPFTERELLVRLHSILRRSQRGVPAATTNSDTEPLKRCGSLLLDCATRESWLHGKTLELTGSQFTVLECLVLEPCKIVSRDDLAMALYGRHASPFERTIDVHISNLRRKIEAFGDIRIRTARGTGYFLVPVRGTTA
jgi:two-component system response regulator CpxR